MARTNLTTDQKNLIDIRLDSVGSLIDILDKWEKLNEDQKRVVNQEIFNALNYFQYQGGRDFSNIEDRLGIKVFLGQYKGKSLQDIEEELEDLSNKHVGEKSTEEKFGSKSLGAEELKTLLADLEKFEAETEGKLSAEEFINSKYGQNYRPYKDQIQRAIDRQIEIAKEEAVKIRQEAPEASKEEVNQQAERKAFDQLTEEILPKSKEGIENIVTDAEIVSETQRTNTSEAEFDKAEEAEIVIETGKQQTKTEIDEGLVTILLGADKDKKDEAIKEINQRAETIKEELGIDKATAQQIATIEVVSEIRLGEGADKQAIHQETVVITTKRDIARDTPRGVKTDSKTVEEVRSTSAVAEALKELNSKAFELTQGTVNAPSITGAQQHLQDITTTNPRKVVERMLKLRAQGEVAESIATGSGISVGKELKETLTSIDKWRENNPEEAKEVRARIIEGGIFESWGDTSKWSHEQVENAKKVAHKIGEAGKDKSLDWDVYLNEVNELEKRAKDGKEVNALSGNNLSETQKELLAKQAEAIARVTAINPDKFNEIIENYRNLPEEARQLKGSDDEFHKILKEAAANPKLQATINQAQRVYQFWQNVDNIGFKIAGKIFGKEKAAAWATKYGLTAIRGTVNKLATNLLAKTGTQALVASFKTMGKAAVSKVLTSVLTKLGLSAIAGSLTGGVGLVVGIAVSIGWDLIKKGIGWIKNKLGNVSENVPAAMEKVLTFGGALILLPAVIMSSISITGTVVVAVLVVFLGIGLVNTGTSNLASMLVPPTGVGGGEELPAGSGGSGRAVSPIAVPTLPEGTQLPTSGAPQGFPVSGNYTFTQGYGATEGSHQNMVIPAVDIAVPDLTPVLATHDGVARAGADEIYGYYVDISGSYTPSGGGEPIPFTTRIAHLAELPFSGTKEVKAGDQIGLSDNTGSSTGPHVHYDVSAGVTDSSGANRRQPIPSELEAALNWPSNLNGYILP